MPRKKSCGKVENFLQQVKESPYFISTASHLSLYQPRVRLFKHEKYDNITAELHHLVKSFDEKLYICETWHKYLYKN